MKSLVILAIILILIPSFVLAQDSNQTVPKNDTSSVPFVGTLRGIYDFLVQVNPILLLVFGGVLVLVSKFARWVGIILIIIALIHLVLSVIQ